MRISGLIAHVVVLALPLLGQVSLQAPSTIKAGAPVEIKWTGNADPKSFVTIVKKGTPEGKYSRYKYARTKPLILNGPEDPGDYEIRFLAAKRPYETLARQALTVTSVTATLKVPASADAGTKINVEWTGPNNPRDFITIVKAGAPERKYGRYVYTSKGSPLTLPIPDDPGEYEIRYLTARKYYTLASAPLTVNATSASLKAPPAADAGSEITIEWTGPNNPQDFITIVTADAPQRKYGPYVHTKKGSPLRMKAPDEPGVYEIRYLTGQKYLTLAAVKLTVGATTATLEAPAKVKGGEPFPVTWTGPANPRDYVTIVKAGAPERKWGNYAYTHRGNPLQLKAPREAGEYEVRYLTGQSYKTLASRPIRVTPAAGLPGWIVVKASQQTAASVAVPEGVAVEVILDASGSMLKREGGARRIDTAKQVLTDLAQNKLPAGTPFAMRVFGHRETGSCRTDLEVPLAPLDAAQAAATIGKIQAMNLAKTPIARSLELVGEDLKAARGQRVVVLITDGEETCKGDPAAAIEKLKAAGIDVRVNIVGFAIEDAESKNTFRYWASLGGGEFYDAAGAGELGESVTRALRAPFLVLNAAGEVVAKGLVGGNPVEVSAGAYRVQVNGQPGRRVDGVVVKPQETATVQLDAR